MKIAIYSVVIAGGGSERFAVVLSKGLADRGHEVFLLTGPKQEGEYEIASNVERHIIQSRMKFFDNAKTLRNFLKSHHVDICVAIGIYPNLVAAWCKDSQLRTKFILSERNAPKQDLLSWKSKLLRALLFRRGDAFVFQTPDARYFYSSSIQRRGEVIPNPLREGLPFRDKVTAKKIVAVGRLVPQKNYPLLLSAFAEVVRKYPDYSLHIYGQGILLEQLNAICMDLGIEGKVFFEGFSLHVHNDIKDAQIYVMTSDFEGLPNALMEAMAMGFPVVSTDCPAGGPAMLIQHGENGLLVPVGNTQSLTDAILSLIANPLLREQLAERARESSRKYELSCILDKWEFFLKTL